MSHEFSDNPYQAPSMASFAPAIKSWSPDLELLKKFRSQIHALGGLWIFFGVIGGIAAIAFGVLSTGVVRNEPGGAVIRGEFATLFVGILSVSSLVWFIIGIFSCLKKMVAVYIGLVLCYVSVIGNIANFNLCALVILGLAIFQAHRVVNMAGQLKKAGIPLNGKPGELNSSI